MIFNFVLSKKDQFVSNTDHDKIKGKNGTKNEFPINMMDGDSAKSGNQVLQMQTSTLPNNYEQI